MTPLRRDRDGSVYPLEAVRNAVLFVGFACLFIAGGAAVLFGTLSVLRSIRVAERRAALAAVVAFAVAIAAATYLLAVLDARRDDR